jgi:broad specificity phosphatase PhoE
MTSFKEDNQMRVTIVRHGETAWNIGETRFRGQIDIELSENGLKQASKVGKALKKEEIEAIFCSPMLRCKQTADGIKKEHPKAEFFEEPLLIDINFGDWQGRKHREVFDENPKMEDYWNNHPEKLIFPNGESWYHVYERIDKFFKKISKKDYNHIAVVSHRVVLNILFLYLLDLSPKHFWDFQIENASISEITFEKNGSFKIIKINDIHHL